MQRVSVEKAPQHGAWPYLPSSLFTVATDSVCRSSILTPVRVVSPVGRFVRDRCLPDSGVCLGDHADRIVSDKPGLTQTSAQRVVWRTTLQRRRLGRQCPACLGPVVWVLATLIAVRSTAGKYSNPTDRWRSPTALSAHKVPSVTKVALSWYFTALATGWSCRWARVYAQVMDGPYKALDTGKAATARQSSAHRRRSSYLWCGTPSSDGTGRWCRGCGT